MDLKQAAQLIREGRLVAFPTETVYGLGANALDESAVERIFLAKGRPSTSPLIVHVDSVEMARSLVAAWPEAAEILARRYWPGPLTLVLPKNARIPGVVTAGLDTAGLRMPAHPVALGLIREAGVPIAAPSANRFTELSPTTAEHVRKSLGSAVDMILDAGPAAVGLESTVLSLAGDPELLRPGMVSREEIEALIGPVRVAGGPGKGAHRSPGMHLKHYSPRTNLVVVEGGELPAGRGAYLWIERAHNAARCVQMPAGAREYAARLYGVLHQLDTEGFDWIAVERPPAGPEWAAIDDRLRRMG
jgi:L-threonylcarbamoyladenylate synthase